jgi:type II secretory pathway pseudopilin PulG
MKREQALALVALVTGAVMQRIYGSRAWRRREQQWRDRIATAYQRQATYERLAIDADARRDLVVKQNIKLLAIVTERAA